MTAEENNKERKYQHLEEICENTRAIRRVNNRILDLLHENYGQRDFDYDPEQLSWDDLDEYDDMYL
jgi:spore germination protein YaaH